LVARPSSPLGQGMRVTANGYRTEPGMNSLIVLPVARVVLPCKRKRKVKGTIDSRPRGLDRFSILRGSVMLVGTLFVGFAHDCRFVGLIFVIIIVGLAVSYRL